MRIFSRFSWKKIMASSFSSKLFILRRIVWASIKTLVILLPLIIVVYFCHRAAALFAKAVLRIGAVIKFFADRDVVLRLLWTGLTNRPYYKKTALYAAALRKARAQR
jgi:hypothetical protein